MFLNNFVNESWLMKVEDWTDKKIKKILVDLNNFAFQIFVKILRTTISLKIKFTFKIIDHQHLPKMRVS